ncbi:CE126 protein, partial [Alectura lathami]|nr:CE126 protein [Alectura lathami]
DSALALHLGWDLGEEHWALKEDQKLCRRRAQKYSIETNRRRRAFEERRKQMEEKEQRFREQVLQQRKVKLRETTEKFQRAHLPASQHKQIVQTKPAFQLEEALEQVKGSVLPSGLYLSSGNKTSFGTTDDTSSSSASRRGCSRQEQISAVVGWDKTMRESSRTSVDNNQLLFQKNLKEMQQLLEKQHLSNLENVHLEVKRTDDSESLSSLDSLEAGERNGNCIPPSESSLPPQCDCALYNPGKPQTRSNDLVYTAENTSKNMHLNNCQRNRDSQNNQNSLPTEGLLAKHNVLTLAEHVNNTEEESSVSHRSEKKAAQFSNSGNQESSGNKEFTFLQNITEERNNPSSGTTRTLATGHPVFNPSRTWASPDSIPGERVQDLMQDQSFKMTPQKRSKSVQTSSEHAATSGILFPNQKCSSGVPSTAGTFPKHRNISTDFLKNTLAKVIETKEENIKCIDAAVQGSSLFQAIPNASVLCDVKQQKSKEEGKANVAETLSLVSDTELTFGTPAQHKPLKNNIYGRKRAKLFGSILKKESKCEASHYKAVVLNHRIIFRTRPVSSIRDSLEIAKSKKKSAENKKNNRKLRWCNQIDQITTENNEKYNEKSTSEISSAQLQGVRTASTDPWANMSAHPSNTTFTKNNWGNSYISKPDVNSATSNKECISLDMFMSTGSSSAKKVWMVSKDEESKQLESCNNYKIHEGNQHKSKAKISRRPRPIRDQSHFVPRNGRDTAVRLQSVTEANAVPAAQGRVLAPQPPSMPPMGSTCGKTSASTGGQPLPSSRALATTANRKYLNKRHGLLADQISDESTSGSSESVACSSEVATAVSTACCSSSCKPLAKHPDSVNSAQTSACHDFSATCAERRGNTGSRLHLGHVPTAEGTGTAWKGAHTPLTPKDSAVGVTQHHVSRFNNSHVTKWQTSKAVVSCPPAGDSSQKTTFKPSSRVNEWFSFHANGIVPVTKQRQIFINSENKHRAFTEQRRQPVASQRWKPTHHTQSSLCAVQPHPVQSAFNPAQNTNNTCLSDEVSESTAQFLMAEQLASTAAAEDEILATMESVQQARQPLLLNTAPRLGMSALSIEEEKIFQSLDHLNQRLQS